MTGSAPVVAFSVLTIALFFALFGAWLLVAKAVEASLWRWSPAYRGCWQYRVSASRDPYSPHASVLSHYEFRWAAALALRWLRWRGFFAGVTGVRWASLRAVCRSARP